MIHASMEELQEIYSERAPYIIEQRLGNPELIVFDSVFINLVLDSFMSGCVNAFSEDELDLLYNFIDFEDGTYSDVSVIALDVWLANLANSIENPKIEGCSN